MQCKLIQVADVTGLFYLYGTTFSNLPKILINCQTGKRKQNIELQT